MANANSPQKEFLHQTAVYHDYLPSCLYRQPQNDEMIAWLDPRLRCNPPVEHNHLSGRTGCMRAYDVNLYASRSRKKKVCEAYVLAFLLESSKK